MGERPTDLGPSSQRQDPQGVLRVGMFARGKLNWLLEWTRAPRFLRFEIIAVAERREGKNTLQFVFTIATKKRLRKKFNLKIRFNPFPSVSFNSTRFDSPPLTRDAYAENPLETRWKPVGAITVVIVRLPREGLAPVAVARKTRVELSCPKVREAKSSLGRAGLIESIPKRSNSLLPADDWTRVRTRLENGRNLKAFKPLSLGNQCYYTVPFLGS